MHDARRTPDTPRATRSHGRGRRGSRARASAAVRAPHRADGRADRVEVLSYAESSSAAGLHPGRGS